jgi:SnoaL-like domain
LRADEAMERIAVCETVYRYALGIDTRDWTLYRSIFADEVEIDFSSYNGRPASRMHADDWVSQVRPLFTGLAATQHSMSNPIVTVNGDRATCQVYMQAAHALDRGDDDNWFTIGGYYDDRLVRFHGRWRIDAVTLTVLWRRGRDAIMAIASERGTAILRGE